MAEEKYNNIGSDTVKAKTGKGWKDWFKILDKEKADHLSHKEIAALLHTKQKVSGWWSQMITVGYEQARGLRIKNQSSVGEFRVDVSKVLPVSLSSLYNAVSDETLRKKWLKEKLNVRKATKDKNVRADFSGKTANLVFMFYEKAKDKSQIVITESKLDDAKHVEQRRAFWKEAALRLEKILSK